jgi:hypothetical protein
LNEAPTWIDEGETVSARFYSLLTFLESRYSTILTFRQPNSTNTYEARSHHLLLSFFPQAAAVPHVSPLGFSLSVEKWGRYETEYMIWHDLYKKGTSGTNGIEKTT